MQSGLELGLLSPQVSLHFNLPHVNVGPPIPTAATTTASPPLPCHCHTVSSSSRLLVFAPPTHWEEYFVFKSLVVRLPYSWTFWQFWLFLVLKLVVILLFVVQGSKVCLPMPPSWSEVTLRHTFFTKFLSLFVCQKLLNISIRGLIPELPKSYPTFF